jgi:hypothetical protein
LFRCRSLASFHTRCTARTARPLLAASTLDFEAICRAFYERVSGETLGMPRPEGAPSRSTVNIADRHTDEFELEFQTGTVFEGSGSLTLRC